MIAALLLALAVAPGAAPPGAAPPAAAPPAATPDQGLSEQGLRLLVERGEERRRLRAGRAPALAAAQAALDEALGARVIDPAAVRRAMEARNRIEFDLLQADTATMAEALEKMTPADRLVVARGLAATAYGLGAAGER